MDNGVDIEVNDKRINIDTVIVRYCTIVISQKILRYLHTYRKYVRHIRKKFLRNSWTFFSPLWYNTELVIKSVVSVFQKDE